MEISPELVKHKEIDEMESSTVADRQNFKMIEKDLTETKSADCNVNLNENSNKEYVKNDDVEESDENGQQNVDIASQVKSESHVTSILNSASFPSMFSSSFSSLKSFAKRSLSTNESGKETNLDGNNKCEVNSNGDENQLETHNQLNIEKRNLMGMARFSIKGLIESSLSAGHTLDSDNEPLQQFFVIMEYIMRHGLKPPKTFFLPNKHFWGVLEHLEKLDSEVAGITDSIKNLPNVRTSLGKGRAWLRMSLMQKKLAQHLKIIVDNKKVFSEWYEKDAFMTSEEGTELIGHLVGLNCIDANLCMKGDDLDNQVTVIDYSLYMQQNKLLKTTSTNNEELDETDENETNENIMQQLADQKNYLEERNRHLETKNSELVEKSQLLKSCNMALENELKAAKIQLHQLQSDRIQIIEEKENQAATHFKTLQEREKDLEMERETLRNSKTSLDELLQSIQKDLRQETNHRMEVENELKQEISSKQELEMTVKLLEKEVFDKQDGILTLREQLDNVKAINHDLYNRLQEKTNSEQEKTRLVVKLEGESRKLATKVVKMQQQIGESEKQMEIARSRIDELSDQLQQSEKQKSVQTNNLQIEREWREALQSQVKVAEEDKNKLRVKADELTIVTQQLKCVKEEREKLQQMNLQHEMTIEDLAGHLGKSKQEVGEIKEIQRENLSQKWEKDKHVTACTLCAKPFNISRRKHHCRKCGQIFCNLCSDNQMTLASSAKPVRVCDNCHQQLMQRFSSN